jgi:hypothetical protein
MLHEGACSPWAWLAIRTGYDDSPRFSPGRSHGRGRICPVSRKACEGGKSMNINDFNTICTRRGIGERRGAESDSLYG